MTWWAIVFWITGPACFVAGVRYQYRLTTAKRRARR